MSLYTEERLSGPPSTGKGRKRNAAKNGGASGDFKVEYAKSNRSTCKGCDEKIIKPEMRIAKKDYESDEAKKFGGLDRWYHVECFVNLRADLGYYGGADELPGVRALSKVDKQSLKAALPKMAQSDIPPPKKFKKEPEDTEETKLLKKQSEELYSIRDKISNLSKKDLVELLESNHQETPIGTSNASTLYYINIIRIPDLLH